MLLLTLDAIFLIKCPPSCHNKDSSRPCEKELCHYTLSLTLLQLISDGARLMQLEGTLDFKVWLDFCRSDFGCMPLTTLRSVLAWSSNTNSLMVIGQNIICFRLKAVSPRELW